MSIIFKKGLAKSASELRIMNKQYEMIKQNRKAVEGSGFGSLNTLIKMIAENDPSFAKEAVAQQVLTANAGTTPADAYKEMDATTTIERVANGEFATLTRLLTASKSIDLGRKVHEYRMASTAGRATTTMDGVDATLFDHVDYKYDQTIVPVIKTGFMLDWRDALAMRAEGFDYLVDESRESDLTLMRKMDELLFSGTDLTVKGYGWSGLFGDSRVVQGTLSVDLTATASTAEDIRNEFKTQRDVLRITNNCTQDLSVGVSREIMSNLERVYSQSEGVYGTILDMVQKLLGIKEVYEDSKLSGNQIIMYWADLQGMHAVVGSAIATEAEPRDRFNSPFAYTKYAALGFVPKTDFSGRKCALFASS